MKKRFALICFIGLFCSFQGIAQKDTSVTLINATTLEGVTVIKYRLKGEGAGTNYRELDSSQKFIYQQKDLSSLLSEQSLVFVRSQGPGNLATTSIRGAGSQHTAVLWNGLNLNNGMNGLVDLSLIPNSMFDRIGVQYGASSSLWGSGAMGGSIHLDNDPYFRGALSLDYGAESTNYDDVQSFNGLSQNLSIRKGSEKLSWGIHFNHQQNDNQYNFSEENIRLSSRDENLYGGVSISGIAADLFWKPRETQLLEFHYWTQNMERDISPALLESNSNASLKDLSHRFALNYRSVFSFGILGWRSGFFAKDLLFASDNIEDAESKSQTFINELYYSLSVDNKYFINIGLNNNLNIGRHKNYADIVDPNEDDLSRRTQNLSSVFASFQSSFPKSKWSYSLSLRQEWRESETLPFTFDLGSDFKIHKAWKLGAQISKMYRVPNLNDLYWNPGGNPNLQAESGYSGEINSQIKILNSNRTKVSLDYSGFYRRINNWIQWTPGLVWSPENILEVESFGNEWLLDIQFKRKKWKFGSSLSYSYVISQNIKANSNNSESLNKQLIYTPINQVFSNLYVQYQGWDLRLNQQYVGYVYTATDHSQFIEPFQTTNLRLQYGQKIGDQRLSLWLGANNLFNQDYEFVISRPMPLRNFAIGIQIHLEQKQKIDTP